MEQGEAMTDIVTAKSRARIKAAHELVVKMAKETNEIPNRRPNGIIIDNGDTARESAAYSKFADPAYFDNGKGAK